MFYFCTYSSMISIGWYCSMDVKDKLKESREVLHLTQDYVAKVLGIPRTAIVQIENGNRKVSAEELSAFSRLYGVSADYLIGARTDDQNIQFFTRSFEGLSEQDQEEILNLIAFKKQMAAKKQGEAR